MVGILLYVMIMTARFFYISRWISRSPTRDAVIIIIIIISIIVVVAVRLTQHYTHTHIHIRIMMTMMIIIITAVAVVVPKSAGRCESVENSIVRHIFYEIGTHHHRHQPSSSSVVSLSVICITSSGILY